MKGSYKIPLFLGGSWTATLAEQQLSSLLIVVDIADHSLSSQCCGHHLTDMFSVLKERIKRENGFSS